MLTLEFSADGTLYAATINLATGETTFDAPILDSEGNPLLSGVVSLQFAPDGTLWRPRTALRQALLWRTGASPVGERERRPVLEARRRIEKPPDLLRAEHHRQPARLAYRRHPDLRIAPVQRHPEEKTQGRDRRVHGGRRGALGSHVQLETPQVLRPRLVRKSGRKRR